LEKIGCFVLINSLIINLLQSDKHLKQGYFLNRIGWNAAQAAPRASEK
jgi:hypothetical protein